MRAIDWVLKRLSLQVRPRAYRAGYEDVMAYLDGARDAAAVLGCEPIGEPPAEILALAGPVEATDLQPAIGTPAKRKARGQAVTA